MDCAVVAHAELARRQRLVGALRRHRGLETGKRPLGAQPGAVFENSRLQVTVGIRNGVVHRAARKGGRIFLR